MSILPSFRPKLALTIVFSFVAPILLIFGLLVSFSLISHLPGLTTISTAISRGITDFLASFGSGNSWRGIVIIGLTCSFVGGLFDTYTFYRYRHLRN
ncbi:hypothetical protein C7B70_03560 [Chlorogloea sp. CCALA 695]|nr:hypothetical protein C7B70_03560 [Chlorogloea sp. CCALA 695]